MKNLLLIYCLLIFSCSSNAQNASELILQYDSPAKNWEKEALPIGNGRMGAMVFGNVEKLR